MIKLTNITKLLLLAIVAFAGANADNFEVKEDNLPCDKKFFQYLCNPKLKIVEKCYDCNRLDNDKSKCFPAFTQFDITDFLSNKKWNCTEHEWKNPFSSEDLEIDE